VEGTYNERKLKILRAARRVVAEQGYHKMTFREVAAEAGISPGTLYYYYNSKNLLLYDILDYSQSQAVHLAEEMHNKTWQKDEVVNRLSQMLIKQVKDINGNKMFLHLLHESSAGDNELALKIKDKYDSWINSFDKMVQMYFDIPPSSLSRSIAVLLNASIDGLGLAEYIGIETVDLPEIRAFFKLFLNTDLSNLESAMQKVLPLYDENKWMVHEQD